MEGGDHCHFILFIILYKCVCPSYNWCKNQTTEKAKCPVKPCFNPNIWPWAQVWAQGCRSTPSYFTGGFHVMPILCFLEGEWRWVLSRRLQPTQSTSSHHSMSKDTTIITRDSIQVIGKSTKILSETRCQPTLCTRWRELTSLIEQQRLTSPNPSRHQENRWWISCF